MRSDATRYSLALLLAGVVTFSLFGMMRAMTAGHGVSPSATEAFDGVSFVRLKQEQREPQTKKRQPPQKPPPPKEPPPPKLALSKAANPAPEAPNLKLPSLDLSPRLAGGPILGGLSTALAVNDRDPIALATPRPMYPPRARRLALSGYVVVEFTVTEDGDVRDPRIIEAEPERIFDQAVERGILRWKFKPRIENGQPLAVRMRQRIEFKPDE